VWRGGGDSGSELVEVSDAELKKYPNCFGCGSSNPIGLRLKHRLEEDHLVTEFVPREDHQGWPDITHGGIIATLLYEVLENLPYHLGVVTMMKSMDTRFRRPAKTGKSLIAESWLVDRSDRNMTVSASLTGEDSELIAEGSAVLVVLSQRQRERLGI
jgi:acyl-coenzyme A thioesterase PaaI-like protein